ncbi:pk-1 [Matsumuraeses phaseoli granulovirus]|uniref:Pk-1 n=1 Tax=Matsumuraeses phaseoli granulovirus TaxID=2760664 RepID=A0AAE7MLA4_9BBAC|nr:pk-1 [Matsumuraeses phaseoli granulovirus]QOD39966.1 pk-1 [Matsumuraeses phaseoli granulovirus]
MNPSKSISRVVQDLKNTQVVDKLSDNDEGSYENVYICKKKGDNKRYVCKSINYASFNPLEFVVPILMRDNPHFMQLHNFVYSDKGDAFIIMDHVADGDLFDLVKRDSEKYFLNEFVCRKILFNLVNALHNLHEKQLIHNDIKLENLLFDRKKKRLFVCDYGLVRAINTPSIYDGTTVYFSPEKITKQPCDPSFDWWAVGVVAYEILSTNYPFDIDEDNEEELNGIQPEDMLPLYSKPLEKIKNVSSKAMDFVTKMLTLDINNRLSTYDEIIKHPFMSF